MNYRILLYAKKVFQINTIKTIKSNNISNLIYLVQKNPFIFIISA